MRRREFLRNTAGGALGWQLALWAAACELAAYVPEISKRFPYYLVEGERR